MPYDECPILRIYARDKEAAMATIEIATTADSRSTIVSKWLANAHRGKLERC